MQKKSSQNSGSPAGGILLKILDLNSEVSIKNWIKESLGYTDPELSNESIKLALEGILRDPLFLTIEPNKKNAYMAKINELIEKL
jgi:hypothetical protein